MFDRKYTWVITGGAGFIGSHLARALLQQGQTVRVVDDFSTGRAENLSGIASQIQLFSGSVCDLTCWHARLPGRILCCTMRPWCLCRNRCKNL